MGCWLLASTSDLEDSGGVSTTIGAATLLGGVSHAGHVALAIADVLAADVVHAAALFARPQGVVVEAAS